MKFKNILYSLMVHTAWLYSDTYYIKKQFKHYLNYTPDLITPKTYQEKIQWLKLNDRKPIYIKMVDKYEAKLLIEEKVGKEYIIPTLGIYNSANEIEYDSLPDEFVIKATHDSGTIVICRDKSKLDISNINSYFGKRLKRNYYFMEREWPYKNVKPRIIVEKLIGKQTEDLLDYKFYCFNGQPKLMFIISNRWGKGGHKADFFDMDGNHMNIYQPGYENNITSPPVLPPCFSKMKELAAILSKDIPHLRVDFYFTDNKIYVGELTFSDGGGYVQFIPDEYNTIIGDWIILPTLRK